MDTTNSGPKKSQIAQQGGSYARGADATQSVVNSGLQGLRYTLQNAQILLGKQQTIYTATHKLSVQWNGSLKTMVESATQQNKAQTISTEAIKNETTARRENTKSSSQENQARQAAKVILDKEKIQRNDRLKADALKNRLEIIQHANLGAAIKHSRDILAERSSIEQQLLKNEREMSSAESKQKVKALAIERNRLQATLDTNTKLSDAAQAALKAHTGGIASASDAMVKFRKKLQDFATGAAIGQAVRKTYEEAQSAKTTGNYANMGQFAKGQYDAFSMGVGSQVYNDIVANARATQLTTSSFEEFNTHLEAGTDKMQTLTGSREEGAKLAGELYQTAGLVGITMADMGSQMNVLGDTFGRLTKLTGKTSAEMAQLSMSIMTDSDHRAVMLGMQKSERAEYVVKRMQDIAELKLQGFSIEQATEMQKLAQRARTQGLAERVGKVAKARASANVLAQQLSGPARAAVLDTSKKIDALNVEAQTASYARIRAIEVEKGVLSTRIGQAVEEGRNAVTGSTAQSMLNTFLDDFYTASGVSDKDRAAETGSTRAQKEAKRDEGNIGGKSSLLNDAATIAGYTTALTNNTAALTILTFAMGANSIVGAANAIKGTPLAGKIMSTVTTAATAGKAAFSSAAPVAMSTAETIARSKGFLAGAPTAAPTAVSGTGLLTAGKLVKGIATGGVGALAGYALDTAADKAGGYGTNLGTGLNLASNMAAFAVPMSLLGPLGTGAGLAMGAGTTAYNYINSPSAKLARQEQAAKEKVEKDTVEQQRKQVEMSKDVGIRTASTDDLQREFFMLAIQFYRNADPLADKASRDKHAAALHRLATNSGLDIAAFAGTPSLTGS